MRVQRWVNWLDEPASVDRVGFQLVPSSDGVWWWGSRCPRLLTDLAGSPASFVLLAPPAVGKSEALKALREREPDAANIAPETRTADGLEQALHGVMGSETPVYLDALDQAALYVPQLFRILERLMSSEAGRRTRWRLACRPAVWDARLAGVLERELDAFEQFRLLPLDPQAAEELVDSTAVGSDRFLKVLGQRSMRGLLSTPGRLVAVAREWGETGRFPVSAREAMELELGHLLTDHDEDCPSSVSDDERRRATQRLAAFHVFSGARRFRSTGTAPADVVAVTSLPTAPEPDRPSQLVGPDLYRAALDGPLFVPASESTVTFEHQPHAEFLAATYVIDRGVGRKRLHGLLGLGSARVLPSSLAGLAAWIATLEPDLVDDLLEINALVLMQSAAELPTDEAREAVVAGLLHGAERGEHRPDWQVHLASLSHPGLTNQLLAALDRPHPSAELVWWVATLAADCGCRDIADDLVDIAQQAGFPDYPRTAAIEAVGRLGTTEQRQRLRSFLDLEADEDRDDELLAATIQVLYPAELSTTELLRALRPRRRRNFFGAYARLLMQLGTMVPDDDLPAAFAWLTTLANEHPNEFERLEQVVGELLKRAWDTGGAAGESLTDMLAGLEDVPRWGMRSHRLELPWTAPQCTSRRLSLAVDVATRLGSRDRADVLLDLNLVGSNDVAWMLDELPDLPEPARDVLARVMSWLLYEPPAAIASRVLDLPASHPAHEHTEHLRGTCTLNGPDAARGRKRAERELKAEQRRVPREEHRRYLRQALAAAERDPSVWPEVVHGLADPNENRAEEPLFADLTARAGWSLLSHEEQVRLLQIGTLFIAGHTPEPDSWRGRKTISGPGWIRDWAGVWLLTTLLRHEPARLNEVDADAWRRLAPSIVGAWDTGESHAGGGLRGALLEKAPIEVHPILAEAALEQLDADIENGRGTISLNQLETLLPQLGPRLVERLLDDGSGDTPVSELIAFLAESAERQPAVIDWLHALRDANSTEVAQVARLHLASLAPGSILNVIVEDQCDEKERRNLVCRLAFPDLDDSQLARFGRALLERYSGEGPYESEVARGDPMLSIENIRWRVLQLLAERGQVETLEAFARDGDGDDRRTLRYLAGQARIHQADQALSPIPPPALIEFLERGDARLVRSDVDLLEVIIEHLEKIQHRLDMQGRARFLWNDLHGGSGSLKPENDISLWLKEQLEDGLSTALVDRELEITPSRTGSGTRIDLTATAPTATHPAGTARVLIEAKRYDNDELLTALEAQLVDLYLVPESCTAGIYLVYWIDPAERPAGSRSRTKHPDPEELSAVLERQARALPTALTVRPVVLDVSRRWQRPERAGQ